jgi:phosphoribosylformylglycinamidine cyclo-ligase
VPPVFDAIQRAGGISAEEMYRVFNMGLGMVAVCDPDHASELLSGLPDAMDVGQIVESTGPNRTVFRTA